MVLARARLVRLCTTPSSGSNAAIEMKTVPEANVARSKSPPIQGKLNTVYRLLSVSLYQIKFPPVTL